MDPKKQSLTPELKQIYDRVMNTEVQGKTTNPAPAAPPTTSPPSAPVAANPTPPPPAAEPAKSAMKINPPVGTPLGTAPANDKSFVFTGNKMTTPAPAGAAVQPHVMTAGGGKKIPGAVIAVLVVVLLAVWGVFWAKILGLF